LKTSYFGNKAVASNPQAVSVARYPPRWWGPGRRYYVLAPSAELLRRSKAGLPWPEYIQEYETNVLSKLDPQKVYDDLSESILCCWERNEENCHRRIIAEWIETSLGIQVPEL
jgi:hypothetical protein